MKKYIKNLDVYHVKHVKETGVYDTIYIFSVYRDNYNKEIHLFKEP